MASTEWEHAFEESVTRERTRVIELLDAARAAHGAFGPAGVGEADANQLFGEKFKAWRDAADEVTRLAESYLALR